MLGPQGVKAEAHRPPVMGRKGMVVSGHPLASLAGVRALQDGGNAVDAAMAVAAALTVVEPHMSGVAGDGFIMIYRREKGSVEIVNATGAAPLAASRDVFPDGIPFKGIRSVSVPGLVAGWLEAYERYGTKPLRGLFDLAIGWAEEGFPVSKTLAGFMAQEPGLLEYPSTRKIFAPEGRPLRMGEILYQRDAARTLDTIAREGAESFYRGELARAMVGFCEEHGGLLTMEDLARHRTRWQEPISIDYRGFSVYEAPPNSSGVALLELLNIVEQFDLRSMGYTTAEAVHLMVEAKRLAFADRERYVADPEWVEIPVQGLLSKAYAAERAKCINPDRAMERVEAGDAWAFDGAGRQGKAPRARFTPPREDTTCFCVVDGEGNAVCQLQSIQSPFGSDVVVEGTGILLNNRMSYWHIEEDHVDRLEPGKRVRHTMNPLMVFKDGQLRLVMGTPGADTQVQTNAQVLTHVLDHGLNVQEAVEAPRWRHQGAGTESEVPHGEMDFLHLESRFDEDTRRGLQERGHNVQMLGPWEARGSEVMIEVDPATGALMGGADPRRDGYAIGW